MKLEITSPSGFLVKENITSAHGHKGWWKGTVKYRVEGRKFDEKLSFKLPMKVKLTDNEGVTTYFEQEVK